MKFLRNKPTPPSDFLPKGFCDIHSHVLPGIDDGSKSMDESLELLKGLSELGIKKIYGTPHVLGSIYPNTPETISCAFEATNGLIENSDIIDMELFKSAEYMLDAEFMAHLKSDNVLPIGKNYLLIELGFLHHPEYMIEMLFDVHAKGYAPIIAHPERYHYFHEDLSKLLELKNKGYALQINLLSLGKYYGSNVYKQTIKLLELGIVDFVGSDIHRIQQIDYLKTIGTKKHLKLLEPILVNNTIF